MAVREAKSRYLVREYMADRDFMKSFTAEEREAYLLLSLFADDAGWLNFDVGELAAAMYRYEDADARESKLSASAEHFKSTGRLKVYRCGHGFMPKVAQRPRGMAREHGVLDAHQMHSKSIGSASPMHSSPSPDLSIPNRTSSYRARDRASGPSGALKAPTARNGASLKEIVGQFEDIVQAKEAKS